MPRFLALAALCLALAGTAALAAPLTYTLPEPTAQFRTPPDPGHAAGFQAAQETCTTCHSADYVAMQPPRKGQAFWDAEVAKMVKVYRAPIEEQQAKAIAAYLSATY
ncbi:MULTISPECIES: SorB family sulfite dehydrogenase c-type cytochrome subunit [unclassified Methylobacterium]|jgi:sulfite dehydrogenase (cytochrome) subunit B|uniref:SorB family sulfite dehydrogenase c-type cytochrome subunit n=1 Tax=unclassified Methylobacterium TaxID=2615210 RepID=UPI0013533DED|nr:cytochrome c [Methylobacterium sp. 2A]MWV20562.1 cytochrome c [Methylobacterium sp. 2A]